MVHSYVVKKLELSKLMEEDKEKREMVWKEDQMVVTYVKKKII